MRFGVHVSIAGGVHKGLLRAVQLGCDCVQMFLMNPRRWKAAALPEEEIESFHKIRNTEAKKIKPIAVHMPYLPNLSAADEEIFKRSVASLRENLKRCEALQIDFLVLHLGKGKKEYAMKRMVEGIISAYKNNTYNVRLLLENTAGQGMELGSQLTEISELYAMIPNQISKGICLDTCHAFAAGYDIDNKNGIRKMINETEQHIGFQEVRLIHLNDSMKPLGSKVDRHARIGEGCIGLTGFKEILSNKKIKKIPCILEVPRKTEADDIEQLKLVKSL